MTLVQRNKLLAFAFIGLTAVTVAFFYFGLQADDYRVDENLFRLKSLDKVNQVVLTSASDTTTLKYDGVRWIVNGRYDADTRMITMLFATLQQMEPRRALPDRQFEEVRNSLKESGTMLELLVDEEPITNWMIGENEGRNITYLQTEGNIFLVTIPGYRVHVGGIFKLTANEWREKRIFNFNWRNFKSLTTHFPHEPGQDFVVEATNRVFGIRGMQTADTARLTDYLDAVSLTEANQFVTENAHYDSLLKTLPLVRIEARDIADRLYSMEVFPLDSWRVLGRTEDGSLLILTSDRWQPLYKGRNDFLP